MLSICFASTVVPFVLFYNVVNTLDWVVSLTSSLENTFMMMHIEMCRVALKLLAYLPKPTEIHSLGILKTIHSVATD